MPRIARISEIDLPHHIVQRGNNRQQIFGDDEDRNVYLELLIKYCKECMCTIQAYCLMLNHTHLLLVPLCINAISKMMQKLSLRYTQHINKKYKRTGRLWECRFYSSVIETDSHLWKVCRYIERNPVRTKIVGKPELYKWSSAGARYYNLKYDTFVIPIWNNNEGKLEYVSFLNQADDINEIIQIRAALSKGIPFGSLSFIENVANKSGIIVKTRLKGRPRKNK